MAILDQVSEQMREALRAKEVHRLAALRSIRAAFVNEMKRDGSETLADEVCVKVLRRLEKQRKESIEKRDGSETLADEVCVKVLRRLEKQRKESIEAFERGGREERAAAERAELTVIQTFLPSLADPETTRAWVKEVIASTGASTRGDVGRVMGAVMKAHKGEIDGGLAKRIASELLGD
jgi:uncharacterized protein YqeY